MQALPIQFPAEHFAPHLLRIHVGEAAASEEEETQRMETKETPDSNNSNSSLQTKRPQPRCFPPMLHHAVGASLGQRWGPDEARSESREAAPLSGPGRGMFMQPPEFESIGRHSQGLLRIIHVPPCVRGRAEDFAYMFSPVSSSSRHFRSPSSGLSFSFAFGL